MRIAKIAMLAVKGSPGDDPLSEIVGNWPNWRLALQEYMKAKPYPRRHWVRNNTLYIEERVSGPGGNDND